jgi:hypothetical protein
MAEKKEQVAAASPGKYEALTGITYPDGPENVKRARMGQLDKVTKWVHVEAGGDVSDMPAEDVPWMLREKFIRAVKP